jgi:hypothetical protein
MIRRIALFMLGAGILAASRVVPNVWGLPGILKIGGCFLAGLQSGRLLNEIGSWDYSLHWWRNRRRAIAPIKLTETVGPSFIRPHRGDRIVIDDPWITGKFPPPSPEQLARVVEFEREARRMIGESIARAQKGTDVHGRPLPRTHR